MFQIIFEAFVIVLYYARCSELMSLGDYPDRFDIDDYPKLIKDPKKNFTILNLADVQLDTFNDNDESYRQITTLVERHHPDLITMTGDQIYGIFAILPGQWVKIAEKLFTFINNFNIPWAPVLGNHDPQGIDTDTLLKMYAAQSNCLFQRGPAAVDGVGNYIVPIFENDILYKTLVFVDSHNSSNFITNEQLNWYNWVINGVKVINAEVQSVLFLHIPLQEYIDGYNEWKSGGFDENGFGERNQEEAVGYSGLFKLIIADNSTKHVFAGHDHMNSYSVMYQGVRLTYSLKTGPASYYTAHLQGGTVISLNEEGVDVYHSFVV